MSLLFLSSIINTADYCQDTCRSLQDKLKDKADANFKEKINLNDVLDTFQEVSFLLKTVAIYYFVIIVSQLVKGTLATSVVHCYLCGT